MSVIDEVKERLDIVEVVSSYVPLKKAGRTYKGLCPFHSEKTPSFIVFPETGTWHCFGACGTGGDVFTFIMKRENLEFGEALKLLAQRAGVELVAPSPQATAAEKHLSLLREINQATAGYFHHLLLNSDEAARARSYLQKRGLKPETIQQFQLGYALDQWDSLIRYLSSKGYALSDVAETGSIVERDDGSGYYDRFRGRVIFPICDHLGRIIGFGGRILQSPGAVPGGEGTPKYLNSPQTPLFDKGSVLFGLDQAKQGIRTAGEAVIVEGYMDVLMAHQHGISNVVAQMGTALTESQLKQLKRHTQRFVLALDSDAAGDQATLRGIDVARQVLDREVVPVPTARGLIRFEEQLAADIRIASLPVGLDPDEVIRDSPSRWVQLVAGARPVMDYYFRALTADLDLATAQGKASAVEALGPLVAEIGNRVQRTHYLQQLARMVQVDERSLWQQIRHAGAPRGPVRRSVPVQPVEAPSKATLDLDEYCLASALHLPDCLVLADEALKVCDEEPLGPDDLSHPEDRAILAAWRRWLLDGGAPEVQGAFYDTLAESLQDRIDLLRQAQEHQPPAPDDLLRDKLVEAILQLRVRNLQRRNRELRFLHEDAQASGDRHAFRQYGQMNVQVTTRIRQLQHALDGRSIAGRRQREDAAVRVQDVG